MPNIVTQIADKVRPVGVATNYGDPVEVGDDTIIPVSVGWFGFGGGGDGDDNGGGGGGFTPRADVPTDTSDFGPPAAQPTPVSAPVATPADDDIPF